MNRAPLVEYLDVDDPRIIHATTAFPGEWLTPPRPGVLTHGMEVYPYIDGVKTEGVSWVDLDLGHAMILDDDVDKRQWRVQEDGERRPTERLIRGHIELRLTEHGEKRLANQG